jgi:hypothetical protein
VGRFRVKTKVRRHSIGSEDFEAKILFIVCSVRASLDDQDLVVESFNEARRDFVLRFAIGGDSVPMTIDHISELLIRLQPLPI